MTLTLSTGAVMEQSCAGGGGRAGGAILVTLKGSGAATALPKADGAGKSGSAGAFLPVGADQSLISLFFDPLVRAKYFPYFPCFPVAAAAKSSGS